MRCIVAVAVAADAACSGINARKAMVAPRNALFFIPETLLELRLLVTKSYSDLYRKVVCVQSTDLDAQFHGGLMERGFLIPDLYFLKGLVKQTK
jgi:hypothetical protein